MKRAPYSYIFIEKRHWFLFLSVLVIGITSVGVSGLKFNPELKAYINPNNKYLKSLDEFENKYSSTDSVFILIQKKDDSLLEQEGIKLIEEITKKSGALPYSYRVESITNYNFIKAEGDDLRVDSIANLENHGLLSSGDYKSLILSEPLLVNRLISNDGKVAVIAITFNLPEERNTALEKIFKNLESQRNVITKTHNDVDIYYGGSVIVEAEMAEIITSDNALIIPLMFLIGGLVNLYLLRSFAAYFAGMMVINLAVIGSLGIAGWLKYEITNVSSMGFMLVIILATADTVHLTSNYVANLRKGMEKFSSLKASISSNLSSIVLTNLTTVIGFLCLNTSGAPQFAAMGNIAAGGILLALMFTLTAYPAILLMFNVNPPLRPLPMSVVSEYLVNIAIRYRRSILITFSLLVVVSAIFMFKLKLNEDPYEYFKPGTENHRTLSFMKDNVKGQKYLYVDLVAQDGFVITQPDYLHEVNRFTEWLRSQQEVVHVFSYVDVIKKMNMAMNENKPEFYSIPSSQELSSQYFLAYELSLAYGQDMSDFTDAKKSSARIVIAISRLNNEETVAFKDKLESYLGDVNVFSRVLITGMDLVNADNGIKTLLGMVNGDLLTLVLTTLAIIAMLRSWRYGLLSLVPNVTVPIFLYGVWGMVSDTLSIAALATFSVCFGILVDDTLHVLVKYLRERNEGGSVENALRYSIGTSGPAIIVTTLIFALGSALLDFSHFLPNAEVGYIMAPMVMAALGIEFLVFPGVIILYETLFNKDNYLVATAESSRCS